jgi:undecaprenyl-diphosphatase
MSLLKVVSLAVVQGLAELLPVSSSAHVVVAEKLMGLDPSAPEMTLLLVMLHTGTMVAVIVYFWKRWRVAFLSGGALKQSATQLVLATVATGIVGVVLMKVVERVWFAGVPHAEIEQLFSHLELIAPALALVGILILFAGFQRTAGTRGQVESSRLDVKRASLIGAVQGVCLPFRGFSRSGATISTGMLVGVAKEPAEDFSFALAVILTPPVVMREVLRLASAERASGGLDLASAVVPSLVGAVCAFAAGLLALRWLSRWLENGRWYLFGIYCLVASAAVALLHHAGY